jgi:predicted phosphodiesterase
MRIAVCSDIHLEFGPIELKNTDNADVLVLSGDICVAKDLMERDSYNIRGDHDRSNKYHTFFEVCGVEFPNVIYIMGNHEHYNGDYAITHRVLKERLGYIKNLHILDKETVRIGEVTFIGGTLWTDMNKEDPMTLHSIRRMMNDFRCVDNSNNMVSYKVYDYAKREDGTDDYSTTTGVTFKERPAMFTPEDAVVDHKAMVEFIRQTIAENPTDKYVVVGHHAPSRTSTHPRYAREELMNGGYSSSLDEFILDNSQIKLWTHGHTHEDFDYMIGSTRVVCNPRGYIHYEDRADHFELKTFQI